ncbi:HIG1 domain family member 1A, mitochondrial [Cephus cinctus]|uniref:HIG1 domain family member 1A, mitochondrial n=1 Tax=Cephus cinctus TaxID=211228 RepID=A0AAJ7BNE3_CEPCN|nr:HIG1 domain family member 1A, mitochondrial [Cephus cinctus]XP_015590369.1 HIG1 domain family member 1A, mitochondrial [Cephus cinctus]
MSGQQELQIDEDLSSKLLRKGKQSPFLMLGIAGLIGTCAYGAYKFKHRGQMSTSIFLMQLRVAAQGVAIGSLTLGMLYHMYVDYVVKAPKKE